YLPMHRLPADPGGRPRRCRTVGGVEMMLEGAGHPARRVDAADKVTGAARYAVDTSVPGMLHGHVVRSSRAHARIVSIEVDAALARPGVAAVITAADLSELFPRYGHIVADHPILALDR